MPGRTATGIGPFVTGQVNAAGNGLISGCQLKAFVARIEFTGVSTFRRRKHGLNHLLTSDEHLFHFEIPVQH